jgi:hypothetical protein
LPSRKDLFLEPRNGDCTGLENHVWPWHQNGQCVKTEKMKEREMVQVKNVGNTNFVYCYGFNISYFHRNDSCPAAVIALPSNVSFDVGTRHYRSYLQQLDGAVDLAPELNHFINAHVLPPAPSHHLNFDINEINKLLDTDTKINTKWYSSSSFWTIMFLALVLVLVLAYTMVNHWRTAFRNRKEHVYEQAPDTVEMTPKTLAPTNAILVTNVQTTRV